MVSFFPRRVFRVAVLLVVLGMLAVELGCRSEVAEDAPADGQGEAEAASPNEKQAVSATKEEADAVAVTVELIDEKGLAERIAAHRGRVVLIDFWATWCYPCKEGFPHTVALHDRLAEDGLAVMSVSFDDAETTREAALDFLQANRATFENFISAYGMSNRSWDAFEIAGGAVPYLKLYDRAGRLHATYNGVDDWEQLDRDVEQLLARTP